MSRRRKGSGIGTPKKAHREERKARIREQLHRYNRTPFLDILAEFIGAAPSPEAIRRFAQEKPDRWAQAVAMIAKVAGFADKQEIEHNITIEVHSMSDAELLDAIAQMQATIKDAGPPLLEAVPVRVEPSAAQAAN